MQCDRARELIGAHIDEELGRDDRASVASHIKSCAVCTTLAGDIRRTSTVIAGLGRTNAPVALAAKIRSRLDAEGREQADRSRVPWRMPSSVWRQAAALAACCMLSVLVTWVAVTSMDRANGLQQEIVTAHIRSLLQDSPIQVASSDAHTVKPWFQGRLDFSPPVPDLSELGWTLVGGRLDYLDGRPVAALVYQRRMHNINVFLWPNQSFTDDAIRQEDAQGYQIIHWNGVEMTYWVVSDLNNAELLDLARALRGH